MKLNNRKLLQDDDDDTSPRTISSSLPKEFLLPTTTTTTTSNTNTSAIIESKHVSTFDTSMALTMLILLIALFFMGFFSVYLRHCDEDSPGGIRRRQRQIRRRSSSSSSSTPASSSSTSRISNGTGMSNGVDPFIIKSLPLVSYEKKYEKEPFDCVVCLCEFEEREIVKMIPHCGHVFHPECIDKWFFSHASCPLCRSVQLLRLPSQKEEKNSGTFNVVEERLTMEDVDTCVEGQREDDFWRIRRTSSWSNGFKERVCLQRSLSM